MQPLSNHYLIATTTDYNDAGDIYAYHVVRVDIMPVYSLIIALVACLFFWHVTLRIIAKLKKEKNGLDYLNHDK